jgi:hypothetical protein
MTRVASERSLIAFRTWKPSIPGIFMSVITSDGLRSLNMASPSSPEAAVSTSCPSSWRLNSRTRRKERSSSMTSIFRAMIGPHMFRLAVSDTSVQPPPDLNSKTCNTRRRGVTGENKGTALQSNSVVSAPSAPPREYSKPDTLSSHYREMYNEHAPFSHFAVNLDSAAVGFH